MNNDILNVKTPALSHADALKSEYGLDNIGLRNLNRVYWNLTPEALYEEAYNKWLKTNKNQQ